MNHSPFLFRKLMEFGEVDNDKKKKVIYFEGPNLPGYLRFLSCVQD